MPTIVRIDEQDRRGQRDIHEVEIASDDDRPETSPPPPISQTDTDVQTDPPPPPPASPPPVLTPPPPQRPRTNSVSEGAGNDVAFEGRSQLVIVDQFIQFRTEPDSTQIYGVFEIANVSRGGEIVIFKVKTTSQGKFHVGPTIGIIRGHSTAHVTIRVMEGETMQSIRRDSFMIQAMVLPLPYYGAFSSSDSDSGDATRHLNRISLRDFQRLTNLWREIADVRGTYVEEHRMMTRITPPPPPVILPPLPPVTQQPPPPAPVPTPEASASVSTILPDQDELRRRLTQVQDQVVVTTDTLESSIEWLIWLVYGLYVLVIVCTLFLLWNMKHAGGGSGSSAETQQPIIAPSMSSYFSSSPADSDGPSNTSEPSCLGF